MPEELYGPPRERAEPEGLSRGLSRILEIEPDERAARRLVGALIDAVPSADSAALLLAQAEGDPLELEAAVGLDEGPSPFVAGGLAGAALIARAPVQEAWPGPPFPMGTRCGAAVPVRAAQLSGALLLGSRAVDRLDEAALALLSVAGDRASLALALGLLARERTASADGVARAEAEVAARRQALDLILAVVGHDLRNPLGAIHLSAALLHKRGGLSGWQGQAVERLRSSAGRMGRIIADLLTYTRVRLGGGMPVRRQPVRLDEVVRRVVDELSAVNPQCALEVDAQGDLGGEWDPDRLEQLVSNLVANAIDHGDPGVPVRIELRGEPAAVTLRVRNRGQAVPEEALARLFEPFARAGEEQRRKGSGLGLGLYIAREIAVAGHGGTIAVSSGEETSITVRLPRVA